MRTSKSVVILAGVMLALAMVEPAGAISKVYLIDGQTRVGDVLVRDGRLTVDADDRLFQHPIEAVHRIEHVTGQSTLVTAPEVFMKEKPDKFSRNLTMLPQGCEVVVLDQADEWSQVEVYGGESLLIGFVMNSALGKQVVLHPVPDDRVFLPPPRSRNQRLDRSPTLPDNATISDMMTREGETEFREILSERLYGQSLEETMANQQDQDQSKTEQSATDQDLMPGQIKSATTE